MPAIMRILGWRATGLRCPDHEISCADADGNPYPVSLIQMPNGTGKTTTLDLLRAVLSGSAAEAGWDRERIKEFQKKNGGGSGGFFEVRLLLNDRRATIVMEFDFENGKVYYKTTHGPGQRDGFHPPADFRRFMNENFVNFFVFDGELAQNLLDRQHTDAERVVENLFQINAFSSMARKVGAYWESQTEKVGATEERGLSRRQNRLNGLRERLRQLKAERKALQEKRDSLAAQLQRQEDAYNQEIKKEDARSKALNQAETKVEQLKGKVHVEAMDVLDTMRDPHAMSARFAESLLALKDGLDKVKLPESAAREFFEDLANETECVCGRPIDADIAGIIRTRAAQYLGSEDVALLNSMKTAIKDAIGEEAASAETTLKARIASLSEAVDKEREAMNELDSLQLEAESSDPAVKKAREEIERLRSRLSDVDEELEKFESKDQEQGDERTYGIDVIEKRVRNAEDRLAEITHTMTLKAKRDALVGILNSAHEKARNGITSELCTQANLRISELMPHNNISIDRIEHSLMLQGQEGGSVGETLSVAYAFLATLFHRSDHQLPFVVDSPAGPIDLAVRPKIGELIPHLTGQFIAFTISSERARFIGPLKRASNTDVQFITLFRKGSAELEALARKHGEVLESGDGLNVAGETFFNEFQLDAEEAA